MFRARVGVCCFVLWFMFSGFDCVNSRMIFMEDLSFDFVNLFVIKEVRVFGVIWSLGVLVYWSVEIVAEFESGGKIFVLKRDFCLIFETCSDIRF